MITVRTYGFPGSFNEANPESSTRYIGKITLHVEADSPPCRSPSLASALPHLKVMQRGAHVPAAGPAPGAAGPLWRRARGALAALGLLLAKFAAKLKALLLLLPKLKLLTTSGSMLVSIAAYSLIWGWRFAVGFVLLLLVHELGHVFQLRREGIPASAPMFIPFLGALVAMKELPKDAAAEARVGLAGPGARLARGARAARRSTG